MPQHVFDRRIGGQFVARISQRFQPLGNGGVGRNPRRIVEVPPVTRV